MGEKINIEWLVMAGNRNGLSMAGENGFRLWRRGMKTMAKEK